jgi:catechol 2,3-dioxygenase-like lactoylglutathione lyase family enzyme
MPEAIPVHLMSCMPVIPSADLERSLRFWVEGLGLSMDRPMRKEGRLIGCMVHDEHLYFWLNRRDGTPVAPDDYEGIRLYWAAQDLHGLRAHLAQLGYAVSAVEERDYGQTEFFVTDDDGYSHCFGVATVSTPAPAREEPLTDA